MRSTGQDDLAECPAIRLRHLPSAGLPQHRLRVGRPRLAHSRLRRVRRMLVGTLDPHRIMEALGRVENLIDGFEREVFM